MFWSGWIIGSIIVYGIVGAVVSCIVWAVIVTLADDFRIKVRGHTISLISLISFIVAIAGVNSLSFAFGDHPRDASVERIPVSDAEFVKQQFGFESGKAYPIILGGQTVGFQVTVTASDGFFDTTTTAIVNGGTAFTVSYTYNGKTWDITVPRQPNTTEKRPGTRPVITLFLKQDSSSFGAYREVSSRRTDCHLVISNLTLSQHCTEQRSEPGPIKFDQSVVDRGLAAWLDPLIDHSTLLVAPEMHDQLIGKIG